MDCNGKHLDLSKPVVMGILNITPDSFYDGGRHDTLESQIAQAEKMLAEGAAILDIGAVSTKPGAKDVSEEEELSRLKPVLEAIVQNFPDALISVDTFRPAIARYAVENGAGIINDIYGGRFDPEMIPTVVALDVPYIMMHMQSTPATMQTDPKYTDVVKEVNEFFRQQICKFPSDYRKIIVDPGFGFGKTVEHNFTLLSRLEEFRSLKFPLLAGLSRKSMINKALGIKPGEALNGTTVLNTIALLKGAKILRVHDVREAVEVIRLVGRIELVTR
jgi:dihydropteroate synthase